MNQRSIIGPMKNRSDDGVIFERTLDKQGVTPHWLRHGDGQRRVHLVGCSIQDKRWLSIDTTETNLAPNGSSKRTMVTLYEQEVRALREFLDRVLGCAP